MNYINVGKIYTTHGLSGELKVKSDFLYKDSIYKDNFCFYVGNNKELIHFLSYRKQNEYDLLCFEEINDVDIAKSYRGAVLYINRDDLTVDFIDSDSIGYKAYYNNNLIGVISDISNQGGNNYVYEIISGDNVIYVPRNDNFISNIDKKSGIIYFNNLEGLL